VYAPFLPDLSPLILSSAPHTSVVYTMALRAACLPVAKLEQFAGVNPGSR
jgi:hypothetical protein